MPIAYIRPLNPAGPLQLVEIIPITPTDDVPPRPSPQPPLIIWGPDDPRPGNPIQLPPWVGKPQPPLPGQPPGGGGEPLVAVMRKSAPAAGEPAPTPPEGMPPGSVLMDVWFGPGTLGTKGWIMPNVSTGPITPPPDPVPAAGG